MLPELETILHHTRADRLSGATALAMGVCNSLGAALGRLEGRPSQGDLEAFALAVAKVQPNMGSVWNVANGLLHRASDPTTVAEFCSRMSGHLAGAPATLAEKALPHVSGRRIITNSSSSAVFHTVLKASSVGGTSLVVCESRPLREGVLMARELGRMGVAVTVIADAALNLFSEEVKVGLVGADLVNSDGVVGKIGIAHMAMACRERNIPMVVLADSSKFAPVPLSEDPRDPSELLEVDAAEVTVENRYFEHVPFELVGHIVTEKGRISCDDARRAVWGVKAHPKLAKMSQ